MNHRLNMSEFYFSKFEDRKPQEPVAHSKARTLLFQFLGILTIATGLAYLTWRWSSSLNPAALWFAVPLVVAETLSFIGTVLIIFNLWSNKDPKPRPPVHYLSEMEDLQAGEDRPVKLDVFIATYNEDVELVRYSIRDARQMTYPYGDVPVRIYVLDDGRRDGRDPAKENMKRVALQEGVGYFVRETNEGYKAGNLKNALEQTDGDLFVILDADTRPFPSLLENTTGYFRNHKLAWVQTPQWFYDVTEGEPLRQVLERNFGRAGNLVGRGIASVFGEVKIGEDIFGNHSGIFYDVLLRRRNYHNAAFCCGAGSVHRREAVVSHAIKDFARELEKHLPVHATPAGKSTPPETARMREKILEQPLIPFKFHASEDIYTSMVLHADAHRWESIQHPRVECKMLSPQDLESWVKQRTRYAAGSLDIAFRDNPLFKQGLSLGQRLCYFTTIWSYFSPLWITLFLLSPVVFYFTLTPPMAAYTFDFFKYFIPFQVFNTLTLTVGCWGIPVKRGDQYYVASFWLMLVSIWAVARREKVKFTVTPKQRQAGKYLPYIVPHLVMVGLTLVGMVYNLILIVQGAHPSFSGFAANTFWSLYNIYNLSIIIRSAFWKPQEAAQPVPQPAPARQEERALQLA